MKQKLQESKNRTQNVLNPSRVNKLKSKLLIMSLSIFCLSINDNGFFQDLNANITDVLGTTNKELYKKVLRVVQQKVCQNIKLKAEDCGLDNEYWAKKAIDDENDRFYNSIKNLEVLIAMSYVVTEEQYNTIVDEFKKAITNSLNKFGELLNESNLESGQDSQDTKLNSEIDKCKNSVLGLINAWMVFETLVQHWWPCTGGTCAIYDNPSDTHNYMSFSDIWLCSTRSPTKNRWQNKQYSPFQSELLSTLESTNEDGIKLYKIISKPRDDGNTGLFKHDFESWLEQFWVIKSGTKRGLEVESSVLSKSYDALQQIEQPVGGDSNTNNKNITFNDETDPIENKGQIDTKIVLQDDNINDKNINGDTTVVASNVNNIEKTNEKSKKEDNVLQNSTAEAEALQNDRIKNVNPNVNPFAGASSNVEQNVIYQNGYGLNNKSNLRNKFIGNVDKPSNYQNNQNSNNGNANINSGNTSNNISGQQSAFYQNNQTSNSRVDNRPGGQNNINNSIQNAFFGKINNSSQNSNNNSNNKVNIIPNYRNNQNVNYNNNNSNNKFNMIPNYRNNPYVNYNQNVNYNIGNGKYNIGNVNYNIGNNALNYRYNPNLGNATNRVWMMPNNFNNFNLMPNNLYSNYSNFWQLNNQYKNTQQSFDLINIGKDVGTAGLNNIGATCFMNASLQCLLHIRPLTNWFLNNQQRINELLARNEYRTGANRDDDANGEDFEQEGDPKHEISLLPYYMKLIKSTVEPYVRGQKPAGRPYSAYGLRHQVEKKSPLFVEGQAGDAKDYVIFLLEKFHDELKEKNTEFTKPVLDEDQYDSLSALDYFKYQVMNEESIMHDCFGMIRQRTGVCKNCEQMCEKQEVECPKMYNYELGTAIIFPLEKVQKEFAPNKDTVNLKDCFDYEQRPELIDDYGCVKCRTTSKYSYTTRIYRAPRVLVLILNRGKGNEFPIKLDFPEHFTLKPDEYSTDKDNVNRLMKNDVIQKNPKDKNGYWQYDLVGVITHIGKSGPYAHFVASCRNSPEHQWFRYNDGLVEPITNFQKDVHDFGTPYVLFYLLRE